jgi:FtsH-binding integral membrane protein
MKQRISTKETLLAMLVLLHLCVAVAHAIAHVQAPVPLSRPALSFVITFALVGPVMGLVMQRTVYPRGGAWVIAATLAGAFWFGLVNHFLTFGPDHVTRVQEAWRALFETTAVFLAVTELFGSGVAVWCAARIP